LAGLFRRWMDRTKAELISDERYISRKYRRIVGKELDLHNPQRFTEKIQWLKLFWRPVILTKCADKIEVQGFVAERTGPELLKKLYGVYDRVEDIDLQSLPKAFVLKLNHGCKLNIFCADKSKLDWTRSKSQLREYMKTNHYYSSREWAYKNIVPRILCEEHLTPNGEDIHEYNFWCFNGKPWFVELAVHGSNCVLRGNMFDLELNVMERSYGAPPLLELPQKTPKYMDMLHCAENLCRDFPFVRVDLFKVNERFCFGELTFYPYGGIFRFRPAPLDDYFGSILALPGPVTEGDR